MTGKEWDKLLERVSRQLYEGRMEPNSISPEMVSEIAGELFRGMETGYGAVLADETLEPARVETLLKLQKNAFHFSGAKNWNHLQEMSALLTDGDGNLKPFSQFLKDVQLTDTTYNKVYLQAEYENAVTSAQMIDKWQQIEAEQDVLPYLTWRTEGSDRVCPICEPLNGLTLKVSHPFWKTNMVPRHFKCHCDIEQNEEGTESNLEKMKIPEVHPMFRTNVGLTGVAFSPKHPYFTSMPAKVRKQVFIASEELIPERKKK